MHTGLLGCALTGAGLTIRSSGPLRRALALSSGARQRPLSSGVSSQMDLISTVTPGELAFIAGLDYGQGSDQHLSALREVVFNQCGVPNQEQLWYPYEVIELGAHHLTPGHEREFVICTLLVIGAVAAGRDTYTDLQAKFEQHSSTYAALPAELRAPVL